MRMILAVSGAALIATLAGCGDTTPDNESQIEVPGPQPYQEELKAMPEAARNATFIRAIRDAGQACQHVESSSFVGEEQGFPVWEARCTESGVWKIMIQNDGVAQVIESAEQPELGIGTTDNALEPINPSAAGADSNEP